MDRKYENGLVTDYHISYISEDEQSMGQITTPGHSRSLTIELKATKAYTISIAAATAVGTGPAASFRIETATQGE